MRFRDAGSSILLLLLLWCAVELEQGDALLQVGSDILPESSRLKNITLGMGCPEFLSSFFEANVSETTAYRYFGVVKGSGYGYMALHFSKLWMPPGSSIVLRVVEGVTKPDSFFNLSAAFPSGRLYDDVLTPPLLAKELRIEFYRHSGPSAGDMINDRHCYGFVADWYYYVLVDDQRNVSPNTELTCAKDNTVEAVCLFDNELTKLVYRASRAVARLLIHRNGAQVACTGWLLGSEGHMLTNHHCVNTQAHAVATTVEFGAEASVCTQDCRTWGACPGTVEAISTRLIRANEELDYALLKLETDVDLPKKYGYLRLKAASVSVGNEIYIPQHPRFYGKRVANVNDYHTHTTITANDTLGCGLRGYEYNGDTDSGSSGSPVIDAGDHGVVALHHCGQLCANTGIPSGMIIADLKNNNLLPASSVDSGDKRNVENFPVYVPPPTQAPRIMQSQRIFDGAIQQDPVSRTVTVDHFQFTITQDDEIVVDVLSAEVSDDGEFRDLNGDCQASYMDAVVFLFQKDNPSAIAVVDDDVSGKGTADGSFSSRDPYLQTFLKAGTYVLAVASVPTTDAEAFAGSSLPGDDPELYNCIKPSLSGSYRIQFFSSTTNTMSFDRSPQAVAIPGTCSVPPGAICAF